LPELFVTARKIYSVNWPPRYKKEVNI